MPPCCLNNCLLLFDVFFNSFRMSNYQQFGAPPQQQFAPPVDSQPVRLLCSFAWPLLQAFKQLFPVWSTPAATVCATCSRSAGKLIRAALPGICSFASIQTFVPNRCMRSRQHMLQSIKQSLCSSNLCNLLKTTPVAPKVRGLCRCFLFLRFICPLPHICSWFRPCVVCPTYWVDHILH